ncbi:phosphatase PAP2 family protein [soil metagenome]
MPAGSSQRDTRAPRPSDRTTIVPAAASQLGYGARFLGKHGWRIVLAFIGILIPLAGFASLVDELREGGGFFFDLPIQLALHRWATPGSDAFFGLMSKLGYQYGVVPIDLGLLGFLVWRRRYRDGLFFGLSIIGALILNLAAKNYFGRVRPDLWTSIAPEVSFSFPSGHAMASVALGVAVMVLLWTTRWRWWAIAGASLFVVLVGLSRIYLGVHFPSDILAGWTAGTAWVLLMRQVVAGKAPTPPGSGKAAANPDTLACSDTAKAASASTAAS